MLLASRPVLYLGFGLRDPDFIYVRDLLANTYKGGIRDHYAIMADVSAQEIDYWRRNYGIHLLNYTTIERPDNSRDHSPLLTLLDELLTSSETQRKPKFNPESADVLLALARHAAALSRHVKHTSEFPIRVIIDAGRKIAIKSESRNFNHGPVERLLDTGPRKLLLIGLPGSGKTYSLHRAAARLAEQLNSACLSKDFKKESITIPIIIDLKLYRGDLSDLISQTLSESLPFNELVNHYNVKIFIDSFNEIPREYLESGSYELDFLEFTNNTSQASLVIGSRTTDGLSKLDIPTFRLDHIEQETVLNKISELGISLNGRFSSDLLKLMQRPFYFQSIISRKIVLPDNPHPRDIYQLLFDNLSRAFLGRFNIALDIQQALSATAYAALNKGSEAFDISIIINEIEKTTPKNNELPPIEIINWLISESILIPYSKGRIAFMHQSITEYLAATELAKQYIFNPSKLKEKLAFRRWDQAIFLTLSFLQSHQAKAFLEDVVNADLALAINASKYIENGRDDIVQELLLKIHNLKTNNGELDFNIEYAINNALHTSKKHEKTLRDLIELGDTLGGIALNLLVSIDEACTADEIISLLFKHRHDHSFCTNLTNEPVCDITENHIKLITELTDQIEAEVKENPSTYNDELSGFRIAASKLLSKLSISSIKSFLDTTQSADGLNSHRVKLLCEVLEDRTTSDALTVAMDLLLKGVDDAVNPIAQISYHLKKRGDALWELFDYKHAIRLRQFLETPSAATILLELCGARPDIAHRIEADALSQGGLIPAALLHCISKSDSIFSELEKLTQLSKEDRQRIPFGAIENISIDWKGRESLFVKILKSRDIKLSSAILRNSYPVNIKNLGIIEIGEVRWWLEWARDQNLTEDDNWFFFRLGDLLTTQTSPETTDALMEEFNTSPEYRREILELILFKFDITTDDVSEEAISFLLSQLTQKADECWRTCHFLGSTATEDLIIARLIPMLSSATETLKTNISKILDIAGARHGRRYLI